MSMTNRQVADLLNLIVSVDGRRMNDQTPAAWAGILDGLSFADCRDAVLAHYQESTGWLTPAHIRKRVAAVRQRRIAAIGVNVNPNREDSRDPKEEIRVRKELTRALGDGTLTAAQYDAYQLSGLRWDEWTGRELAA